MSPWDGGLAPMTGRALALLVCGILSGCGGEAPESSPPVPDPVTRLEGRYAQERLEMVRFIASEGVTDSATLEAMRAVPRDQFVPPELREHSYADRALPIAEGQTISQPQIVAFMTQAIRPRPGLRVLEVGTGSGYQAALLSHIGCRVHTIELVQALADSARARLDRLGYGDVEVRHGDGWLGWPEAAPFDAILVTAATEKVPSALIDQLAPGGRLVIPVGREDRVQWLTLIEKDERGDLRRRSMLPVRFIPMRRDLR